MGTRAKFFVLLGVLLALALTVQPTTAGVKINIGSTFGPDAPVHFGQVKFKELVEQRSNCLLYTSPSPRD